MHNSTGRFTRLWWRAALLLILTTLNSLATDPVSPEIQSNALHQLSAAAASTREVVNAQSHDAQEDARGVANLSERLQRKWDGTTQPMSAVYVGSLAYDREELVSITAGIRQTGGNDKEAKARLQQVVTDLRAKTRGSLGLDDSSSPLDEVKVTVITRKTNVDANGYFVRCNYPRYTTNTPARFPFNDATSPSVAELPPGLYFMWVEDSQAHVISGRDVTIYSNRHGQTNYFDLP